MRNGPVLLSGIFILLPSIYCASRQEAVSERTKQAAKVKNDIEHDGWTSSLELDRSSLVGGVNTFLHATFTIRNRTDQEIPFTFSSSQEYDFSIEDSSGRVRWRWSHGQFFAMIIRQKELGREPWVYKEHIPLVNQSGAALEEGSYTLRARLVTDKQVRNQIQFRVQ